MFRKAAAGLSLALTLGSFASLAGPAGEAEAAPVAGTCTLWASPTGADTATGSSTAPFRSLKRLGDALTPGAVGCLRSGSYAPPAGIDGITLTRGGTVTAPATIRSAPGADATVVGRVVVGATAPNLVLADIVFNGVAVGGSEASSLTIEADGVSIIGNEITAPTRICIGSGHGRVVSGLLIEGNRIHHCGDGLPRNAAGQLVRQEHGVYLSQTRGAVVRNNVIDHNFTRGVQLYYDADGTIVENNVIDANEVGINIGARKSNGIASRSESNVVRNNLITNSKTYGIEAYFDEVRPIVGDLGNVVTNNCLYGADANRKYNLLEGFRYDASNGWIDPQYNGQPVGDYRLRASSPCIGKGLRASVTPRTRSVTATSATFHAAINPNRMTTNYFVRVRSCSDTSCTTTGPWIDTPTAQVVDTIDVNVSRSIAGLAAGRTYQFQWVAHQALLPSTNPAGLVTTALGTFTTPV